MNKETGIRYLCPIYCDQQASMRKWPSGRCQYISLNLYIKIPAKKLFHVRQLFSEYRWSSRQVPMWFSG